MLSADDTMEQTRTNGSVRHLSL